MWTQLLIYQEQERTQRTTGVKLAIQTSESSTEKFCLLAELYVRLDTAAAVS
jgi:hypothetical protein